MTKIYLKLDEGVPQYVCSLCSSCSSTLGLSLCSIKNRGCCSYYPRFGLQEIHRMVQGSKGLKILYHILELPGCDIYKYYIHAKGSFDEQGYNEFLKSGHSYDYDVRDKSCFFRTCPFVKPGMGCTLPVRYRNYVCNFFICREVSSEVEKNDDFKLYIKERESYVKWVEWENASLEMLLKDRGINLQNNLNEVISLLQSIPLEEYEFPQLPSIETFNDFSIGA